MIRSWLRAVSELTKFPVAAASTLSAVTGYLVFSRSVEFALATAALGVLLLAMGSCALNEAQDRDIDAQMTRTRGRPIPSGKVTPAAAIAIALTLDISGFLLLWFCSSRPAALIALFAALWYNGVYTYLKRIWAFAVIPGALIGALPPAIGWAAAGGNPLDPRVHSLCFFFFIWQVPHFWLLLSIFGSDYSGAGLPSLAGLFNPRQLTALSFMWMIGTSVSGLLLPMYRVTVNGWAAFGLLASGAWLAWRASKLLGGRSEALAFRVAFRSINLYALSVMTLLMADSIL
jgi:heme o synthase